MYSSNCTCVGIGGLCRNHQNCNPRLNLPLIYWLSLATPKIMIFEVGKVKETLCSGIQRSFPPLSQVEPYVSGSSSLGQLDRGYAPLNTAINEADVLVEKTDTERLETCRYISAKRSKHKLTVGEPVRSSQHYAAKSVKSTDILKQCNPISIRDLGSLEKLLAGSSFDLKEFIQTNFTVDGSGVLRLTTSPKGTARNGKKAVRRKKRGTLEMDAEYNRSGTAVRKLGRQRKQKTLTGSAVQNQTNLPRKQIPPTIPQNQPTSAAVQKQISPTIPDYFDSSVVAESVNKLPQGDQEVPDSISCAEAQAKKEMEEIEGMLTIFEDESSNPGSGEEQCHREVRGTVDRKDGVNSEWVESVLGDINQIEGKQKIREATCY